MLPDYKIVLCGEYNTGKTCLVTRLVTNKFDANSFSTIGASFRVWAYKDDKFGIWDTAGQERFAGIMPAYIRESDIAIYCWENSKPFDYCIFGRAYKMIKQYAPTCLFYLVFTKIDLNKGNKQVIAINFADEGLKVDGIFYTSALTGEGVLEFFSKMATEAVELKPHRKLNLKTYLDLHRIPTNTSPTDGKACCVII